MSCESPITPVSDDPSPSSPNSESPSKDHWEIGKFYEVIISSSVSVIYLVGMSNDSLSFACFEKVEEYMTPQQERSLKMEEVSLLREIYLISPALHSLHGSWPVSVMILHPNHMNYACDGNEFIRTICIIKNWIQKAMTSQVPKSFMRRVKMGISSEMFKKVFSDYGLSNKSKYHSRSSVLYEPEENGDPLEEPLLLKSVSGDPINLVYEKLDRARQEKTKVVLRQGQTTGINKLVKRLKTDLPERYKAERLETKVQFKQKEVVFVACLTSEQIQELEYKIGSFSKKKVRGHDSPTLFIEDRREGDPVEYPCHPKFLVTFSTLKSEMNISFTYFQRLV